ncbi:MAG: hypothetical protein CME13_01815 [Gemmatimonadetes bacterium]|nr:hypothetical protein [Gemmatimonadota bacterium]|tara:strand:- start:517 stop:897 length:381 start_codon:yes stop_codon:yes gene_type:complete
MTATLPQAHATITPPVETATAEVSLNGEVAPHHTEERREQLTSTASRVLAIGQNTNTDPNRRHRTWQEVACKWIEGDDDAVEAFTRLLVRLDRYQDVLRHRRLCRGGGDYRKALRGLASMAFRHQS